MDDASVPGRVVVIDAQCVLCNRFARFVAGRDRRGEFRFAGQDSAFWRARRSRVAGDTANTVLLVEEDRVYTKSAAVLRVLRGCGFWWSMAARAAEWCPTRVRDRLYDYIARRRRQLFGAVESCPAPEPEFKARFLD